MAIVGNDNPGRPYVLIPPAARTADFTSDDLVIGTARGLMVVIDVQAITATPGVVFNVQGVGPADGAGVRKTFLLLASVSQTAVTATPLVLRIHPELTAAANTIAKDLAPQTIRIFADHTDADSITYAVEVHAVL